MKKLLDQIEYSFNRLEDIDANWWPFLFLRPPKDKKITRIMNLKMTFAAVSFYYLPFILLFLGFVYFQGNLNGYIVFIVICIITSFYLYIYFLFRVTKMFFWNRRAEKIAKSEYDLSKDLKPMSFNSIVKSSFLCGIYLTSVSSIFFSPIPIYLLNSVFLPIL